MPTHVADSASALDRPPAVQEPQLCRIEITGIVQGVGFRPFVYRLAHEHSLAGWVRNTSWGVEIEVEGPQPVLAAFTGDLRALAPPLARIESLHHERAPAKGLNGFHILPSRAQEGSYQLVSPDIATCPDCLGELLDPQDRRYRYPFTNCTNCGPRFTIIQGIPYDRPRTTMSGFVMCPDCQREYDDPLDRRFHAQPNACPVCGPQLALVDAEGNAQSRGDLIAEAARRIVAGQILAIKGLGGFHLACDATNEASIRELRRRKRRPAKPLAVMMATMDQVRAQCIVSPDEEALLSSPQCPIVLLPWRDESAVSPEAAPAHNHLGVMLPYTPLHHVLLRDVGRPLVMTSGNLSEEPIAQTNDEALQRLAGLADAFLLHNRDIHSRYDDSVWFVPSTGAQPIRRSRGYAPHPFTLPFDVPQVLACGPELKNTFCLTRDRYAFLSQHIGDLQNLEALEYYEESIGLLQALFRIEPRIIAHDLHPDYLSTRHALEMASADPALQLVPVQHHYAHIISCLADNAWDPGAGPVIGVSLDGTGFGTDGAIWGGEFLVAGYDSWERAGQLEYLPLVGGESGIRNPYRLALAYGLALTGEWPQAPALASVAESERETLRVQVERGLGAPSTSSCGRLFDAVAALLGVRGRVSYEAQAAIELEAVSSRGGSAELLLDRGPQAAYPFHLEQGERTIVRLAGLWRAIEDDIGSGLPVPEIGRRFHSTVAAMALSVCQQLRRERGLGTVALSGGCFQNRLLLVLLTKWLRADGFHVLLHHQVPCNDGGVSLGQAAVAARRQAAQGDS